MYNIYIYNIIYIYNKDQYILPKPQSAPTEMTTHNHSNSCLARRPAAEFGILVDFCCACLPVESRGWPKLFAPVGALKALSSTWVCQQYPNHLGPLNKDRLGPSRPS